MGHGRRGDGCGDVGQAGWFRHRLRHRGDARRVLLGIQALEEGLHLGFEGGDDGGHPLDPCLDRGDVLLHLALEPGLAGGDPTLRLLADARNFGLGPLADGSDVVVRLPAQGSSLVGGAGLDLLDHALGLGLEPRHQLGSRGFGRDLHRTAELGHELGGLAGRLGLRVPGSTVVELGGGLGGVGGLDHLGFLGLLAILRDGGVAVGHLLVGAGVIRLRCARPREPEAWSSVGSHGARTSMCRRSDRSIRSPATCGHRVSGDGSGAVG